MKYPKEETPGPDLWIVDDYIDIDAPPIDIWPWLAQMGNGRAGWYSYDWIDNLGKKSFDYIDPELVKISKNQKIPFGVIIEIDHTKYLTFQFGARASMSYFLEPLKGQQTRLWGRLRYIKPSAILKITLKHAHIFMQDKQFLEIKRRVESHKRS